MDKKLDLPAQFEAKVMDMLNAVNKGRLLHKAKNIKSSGELLELEFRSFLQEGLAKNFIVNSGYFYGSGSSLSNECDVMICDDMASFDLSPASTKQAYLPYSSLNIIGQIKSSASQLKSAMNQIEQSYRDYRNMTAMLNGTGVKVHEPISFILCATDRPRGLKKLLQNSQLHKINYILFLAEGQLVAGKGMFCEDFLSFGQINSKSSYHLWEPVQQANKRGVALLWFYFSLLSYLHSRQLQGEDNQTSSAYELFCRQIDGIYKMRIVS